MMSANDGIPAATLPSNLRCQVLIVGYGPVGMATAILLAQSGVDVVVVERHEDLFGLPRAGHLDGETMRTFQGMGVAESVELVARPTVSFRLVDAQHKPLTDVVLGEDGSGWKVDYISYQPEVETILSRRAAKLGARIFMGSSVVSIVQDDEHVTTLVTQGDGANQTECAITSDFVIGADGAGSFVREAMGIARSDLGIFPMPHLVVDFEHNDPDRDIPDLPDVFQVLDIARPHIAGRWNGGRWSRWEFTAIEGESREYLEKDETCWALLAPWGITPEDGRIVRRAVYSFASTVADRWRVGRVFLVGDAAHTMPPFLGQGMLSGIRDAVNLAWKLDAVLDGRADGALLDSYQSERSPHVKALIEASVALGQMIVLSDPEQAKLRDEMLRSGQAPAQPLFPRLGPGLVRDPGSATGLDAQGGEGRPALQARVARGGRVGRLDDILGAPGWRVISRHKVPIELFNSRQRELIDSLAISFVHVTRGTVADAYLDIDGEYDLWFRRSGRKVIVERPDHYVFATAGSSEDVPAILDELADTLMAAGWKTPAKSVNS